MDIAAGQQPLTIPVCYDRAFGPDVEASAEALGLSADRLIEAHAGASYRVDFLGFSPGFGYLSGLPRGLRLPRHAAPRPRVPAGSVAIAENRSAVYPSPTPGGWRLIGRTPWVMFDPHRDPPSLLRQGDAVRFERIDEATFERLSKEAQAESEARREAALSLDKHGVEGRRVLGASRGIRVVRAGGPATVQDLGRFGYGDIGVAPSGAADALSLRLGNRLLGQPDGEAGIEMTLVGGVYRFEADAVVCLAGADAPRAVVRSRGETQPIAMRQPLAVRAGDEVEVGPLEGGVRAYLCVKGGLRTPAVLGSRSTHVPSGLGGVGRLLQDGDELLIARMSDSSPVDLLSKTAFGGAKRSIATGPLPGPGTRLLRIVPGRHRDRFPPVLDVSLPGAVFEVDPRSDRTGVRLRGAGVWEVDREGVESEAVLPGAVQVPPDGHPIVLGVDGPTVGGYPVLARVIEADLSALGQLRPGDGVRFAWIPPEASESAAEVLREQQEWLDTVSPAYMAMGLRRPVLACDAGEAELGEARRRELALLPFVSLVHVACGGHAGDGASIRAMVSAAAEHGCAIGAHPSYPDRANFGRVTMDISAEDLRASLAQQLRALRAVCDELGAEVVSVKPHGALYHRASDDPAITRTIAEAVTAVFPVDASGASLGVALVALTGSTAERRWREMGLTVWAEGYADRAYEADGTLRPRDHPGAVISDPDVAAEQARQLRAGRVRAYDGSWLSIDVDVLTVHGDTPGAAGIAERVVGFLMQPKFEQQ
ncbi:MAG: 5-oxoprolinase/urea amidolyase family protein [Planctomycetota bacterium]